MRHFLLAFLLCTCGSALFGQQNLPVVQDVLHLRSGGEVRGQILELKFGDVVLILTPKGETKTFKWNEVKRVGYREFVGARPKTPTAPEEDTEATPMPFQRPTRAWFHRVHAHGLLGREALQNDFSPEENIYGLGISAYHLRALGKLNLGVGIDYANMHFSREERTIGLLGTAELNLPVSASKNWGFNARLNAGPTLPLIRAASGQVIESRKLSMLVEPSLGINFSTDGNPYSTLSINLGYRFLDAGFTVTTATLDLVERTINYRRVMLGAGYTF
ncbi:hypothetical protein [Lewinella sp. 4G2]|uniref:hypothetical protein n=1 Tax=Lewinella sp. 4G2 TaxID=1803372 RepID=UPI0007B4D567|nr:hypothetical protein [Lewinella sp. 4G2]OAV45549.1 hypothetical protein A3850_014070 [Lewinella sp. 4G2]